MWLNRRSLSASKVDSPIPSSEMAPSEVVANVAPSKLQAPVMAPTAKDASTIMANAIVKQ